MLPGNPRRRPWLTLDRLTRVLVLASAVAALALQTVLGARAWEPLRYLLPSSLVVAYLAGRVWPRLGWWAVLLPAYVFPALLRLAAGNYDPAYVAVWFAAILGLVLATSGLSEWTLPVRWRLPLALWAFSIALSWPIVVLRELDFNLSLLNEYHVGVTSQGIPPAVECVWILHVAILQMAGLLWLDALFRRFGGEHPRTFENHVVWPLAVSATVTTAVAIYQMFGDIMLFNSGWFAYLGRASGATLDGNGYGMIAALWAVGVVVLALGRARRGLALAVATLVSAALALGVLGSGSRSALLAMVVAFAVLAYAGLRTSRMSRRTVAVSAGVALMVVALVVTIGVLMASQSTVGPIARLVSFLTVETHSAGDVVAELWNRNWYGRIATGMFLLFSVVGTGVGSFNALSIDYSLIFNYVVLKPDNAQNWFRHQLVEFGVLGSVGWLVWVGVLLWLLVTRVPANGRELPARAVKGLLVAIGLASLVGMPTQSPFVLLTFWALVFWLVALATAPDPVPLVVRIAGQAPHSRLWWPAVWVLAFSYAAGTAYVGVTALRVPYRAIDAYWDYAYGLYDLEHTDSGESFRWTGGHSVAVFPATAEFLKLTFWVNHPDVANRPVHVRIWRRNQLAVDVNLRDTAPVVRYIRVTSKPRGRRLAHIMIETRASRTWSPSTAGGSDHRELGLCLSDWTFVSSPPPGAVVIN